MTYFNYINTNIERVKKEVKMGHLSTSVLTHYRIYSCFDKYRKLGCPICQSACYTAKDLKISEILVKKIKKQMETEV